MQMHGVSDPNSQLIAVGWEDGTLRCRWRKGEGEHTGVPEDLFLKLRRVPFAYRQYNATIKGKFPYTKIEDPPEAVNGTRRGNIQDAAGRDSDSGAGLPHSHPSGEVPEPNSSAGMQHGVHVGRCDAQGTGGRVAVYDDRESYYTTAHRELDQAAQFAVAKENRKEQQQAKRDVQKERFKDMEFFRAEDGLTFTEEGHKYHLQGKPLISLTQILDAAGLVDYSAVAPDVLANKASFGTKVHEYTMLHDTDDLDPEDWAKLLNHPKYGPRLKGWVQFCEDFNFTPDQNWIEVPCAVKVNGMTYAMTIDRFGILGTKEEVVAGKGMPAVVEIKTCCDREPSHQIQTAGQAIPFRGDGSVPLKRFAVYLLDKPNGGGKFYRIEEHTDRADEKIFLCALTLTQFRINNKLLKG